MFDGLDAIPWGEVRHAYGRAVDTPRWIRLLDSEDPDLRADAVNQFLWSSVFHQYTLYPATPFVIPFVMGVCNRRRSALVTTDAASPCA